MRLSSAAALMLALAAASASVYDEVPLTRDLSGQVGRDAPEQLAAQTGRLQPLRARTVLGARDSVADFVILMEEGLSDSVGTALLTQWLDDIEADGIGAQIVEISYAEPEEIRAFLDSLAGGGMQGTLLVGDLPTAWSAVGDDGLRSSEMFPSDYFYMDLDGEWQDLWIGYPSAGNPGQDGFYDTWSGELGPEIWAARIRVDNLSNLGDPVEMLQEYLERNHTWRLNGDPEPVRALCYVDDDWSWWGSQYQAAMELLYEDVELFDTDSLTSGPDYEENRLPDTYVWISPYVHSGPWVHQWSPGPSTFWDEILPIGPSARFYNLFACSNCRFTTMRYMGGVYAFATETGLAAVGSTKSGAMLHFDEFYGPLGGNATLGEAYRLWWDFIAADGLSQSEKTWHLGMVLLGDPTLAPSKFLTGVEDGPTASGRPTLAVAPNPAAATVTVFAGREASGTLRLYDAAGRAVASTEISGTAELGLVGLARGVYTAVAEWSDGTRAACRLTVLGR
jgi:hypothetical protein